MMTFPPDPCSGDPTILFRHILDFPGYGVDTTGSVWGCRRVGRLGGISDDWHRLKLIPSVGGYLHVSLRRDGRTITRYVHHLVLEAFVGPSPDGLECCHGDGNPANNFLGNLRWDTSQANTLDCIVHGNHANGERVKQAKLRESDVAEAFRLRSLGLKHRDIAARLGVSRSTISMIFSGKTWRHLTTSTNSVALTRSFDRLTLIDPRRKGD